jgi:hypothetical protein
MRRFAFMAATAVAMVFSSSAFAYLDEDDTAAKVVAAWKSQGSGRLDGLEAEVIPVNAQAGFATMTLRYQLFIKGTASPADHDRIVSIARHVIEPLMKESDDFDPDRLEVNDSEVTYASGEKSAAIR